MTESTPWQSTIMSDSETPIIEGATPLIVPEADPSLYPSWAKCSQIPHPALVPAFISRREGLQDGSIDPSSGSISTQLTLLHASQLSPSLAPIVSNIPAQMMLESIHKRNLQSLRPGEEELKRFREPQLFTLPPAHYHRTIDPHTSNAASSTTANQTAAELASMNILYGGVKGRVYLDSVKTFLITSEIQSGSEVERIIKDRIESLESVCGQRVLNMIPDAQKPSVDAEAVQALLTSPQLTKTETDAMMAENHQILKWLNEFTGVNQEQREALLLRLRSNLVFLVANVPIEQRSEYFKGVDFNLIK